MLWKEEETYRAILSSPAMSLPSSSIESTRRLPAAGPTNSNGGGERTATHHHAASCPRRRLGSCSVSLRLTGQRDERSIRQLLCFAPRNRAGSRQIHNPRVNPTQISSRCVRLRPTSSSATSSIGSAHLLSHRGRFDAFLGWPDGEEMPADPAATVSVFCLASVRPTFCKLCTLRFCVIQIPWSKSIYSRVP
jgi:hypothetical protein